MFLLHFVASYFWMLRKYLTQHLCSSHTAQQNSEADKKSSPSTTIKATMLPQWNVLSYTLMNTHPHTAETTHTHTQSHTQTHTHSGTHTLTTHIRCAAQQKWATRENVDRLLRCPSVNKFVVCAAPLPPPHFLFTSSFLSLFISAPAYLLFGLLCRRFSKSQ